MSDEIKPALTPDEWRDRKAQRDDVWVEDKDGFVEVYVWPSADWNPATGAPPGARHALAALCLYGQEYGFTPEDVAALAEAIDEGHGDECCTRFTWGEGKPCDCGWATNATTLRSLASRIAALLPPST